MRRRARKLAHPPVPHREGDEVRRKTEEVGALATEERRKEESEAVPYDAAEALCL